jgi:UDP-N-acetylmuramyl pentapeptide synthase
MSLTLSGLVDWLESRAKPVVKSTYQRPIIRMAAAYRRLLPGPRIIGITGSAGKTTTKELLHAALASRYRCTKSVNSNNQLYDVARSVLGSPPWIEFCAQEVGASVPGKLAPMMAVLRPQIGVVTNVGEDHIYAFGSREAVAAEKVALVKSLPADGLAVLNADDPLVVAMARDCRARVVTYGLHNDADFRAEVVTDSWPARLTLLVRHGQETVQIATQLLAGYHASNVLAAVATACSLGVPLEHAAAAVARHEPTPGRMSVSISARGVTFIRDDWKAPAWSLLGVMSYMAGAQAPRKVIVLGTISDGDGRPRLYRDAVMAGLAAADRVLLVGPRAAASYRRLKERGGDKLLAFTSVQDASKWLTDYVRAGDLVLLKGSTKADHLARLALALDRDVRCWRARCGRKLLCDRCGLSGIPAGP